MQEHEDRDRQAQLRLAAEALISWIHARRLVWADEAAMISEFSEESEATDVVADAEPPSLPPPFTPPPPVFTPPPPVFTPPPMVAAPPPVPAPPPPVFTPPPPMFADAPAYVPVLPPRESPEAFDAPAVVSTKPPVAKRTKPAVPLRVPVDAIRSLLAPLVRVAPAAALLVVVLGAGWLARPYVGRVKALLADLTTTAPSKPEPVLARPKPPPPPGARRTGVLMARSEPAGARVLVDGRDRGVTPLTLDDLVLGSHVVVIESDKGSVRRTVTVATDRTAVVSESIFAGWLNVYAPFEIQVSEGSRPIRLDETSRTLLPPGPHELLIENRDLGYRETRTVEIDPGQTTSLSLTPPASTLNVTSNVPAVVLIDGEQVGDTPLSNHLIALGTRDIVVKSADGAAERQFSTKVTVAPVQIDVDFSKP